MKKRNWLHLDIDKYFKMDDTNYGDGIDEYGLRPSWKEFEQNKNIDPLVREITRQYQNNRKSGAVLSFPSDRIISSEDIKVLEGNIKVIYLASTKENCLKAFLEREVTTPRVSKEINKYDHWDQYNRSLLEKLSEQSLISYKFDTFEKDGTRKSEDQIYTEINGRDYT